MYAVFPYDKALTITRCMLLILCNHFFPILLKILLKCANKSGLDCLTNIYGICQSQGKI